MGRLWDRWRNRYPRSEDQPPLPPAPREVFPAPPPALSIQLMGGGFPGSRVWFLSEEGDRLVQIQADRLVLNWRRVAQDSPYPRYDRLRPEFSREAADLLAFLTDEGLGEPEMLQAEVVYTNPIPMSVLGDPPDLGRLLAPWSGQFSDAYLSSPEDARMGMRFRIPDPATGEPVGRLYVEANPAIHPASGGGPPEAVFMVQLFARGRPLGEGLDGALKFLDLGHDWVVRGFTSLTTESMHTEWGRKA